MDDNNPAVNPRRLRTLWLMLFIPVAVGIHHFYFKPSGQSAAQPLLILDDSVPSVSLSEANAIKQLQDAVDTSSDEGARNQTLDDLISRADQTIYDTDKLLSTLDINSQDAQSMPTDKTRQLRDEIQTLNNATL